MKKPWYLLSETNNFVYSSHLGTHLTLTVPQQIQQIPSGSGSGQTSKAILDDWMWLVQIIPNINAVIYSPCARFVTGPIRMVKYFIGNTARSDLNILVKG